MTGHEAERALADVEVRHRQVGAAKTAHWWVHVLFAVALGGGVAAAGIPSPPARLAVWGVLGVIIVAGGMASRRPRVAGLLGMPALPRREGISGRQLAAGTIQILGLILVGEALTRGDGTAPWNVRGLATGLWYLVFVLVVHPAVMRFPSRAR